MKRKIIVDVITVLLIILWCYAAVSKFADYQTFKLQLGKSPLLTRFASTIAIGVPIVELLIAIALTITRYRTLGLYSSLFLLTLFIAYIVAILNFSYYIPCSCGGLLSALSWKEHIVFNASFSGATIFAIILNSRHQDSISANRFPADHKLLLANKQEQPKTCRTE